MIQSKEVNSIQPPTLKRNPTSFKDLKTEDIGELIALQFNKKAYHSQLNNLHKDLRAFIYDEVKADIYYLVFDMNSGIIVGGFTTNKNGNMNGLFSLVKGIGNKLFELRLKYALKNIDTEHKYLNIFCIGDKLKNLYNNFGFEITSTIRWNDELAPKNWNYDRFGRPDLYIMRRLNESK